MRFLKFLFAVFKVFIASAGKFYIKLTYVNRGGSRGRLRPPLKDMRNAIIALFYYVQTFPNISGELANFVIHDTPPPPPSRDTPIIFSWGCAAETENLNLYQTMLTFILQPYSRVNTYPILDLNFLGLNSSSN